MQKKPFLTWLLAAGVTASAVAQQAPEKVKIKTKRKAKTEATATPAPAADANTGARGL